MVVDGFDYCMVFVVYLVGKVFVVYFVVVCYVNCFFEVLVEEVECLYEEWVVVGGSDGVVKM